MNKIKDSAWNDYDQAFDSTKEQELEKLREDFVCKYTLDKIANLSLDEYVVGKQNSLSFCNCLENILKDLGDMHGSPAIKFGVYYGKNGNDTEKKYRFSKKYGKNLKESFVNVKLAIVNLVNNAKDENIQGIKNSKLAPVYRGKILSTYFPDRYLNIFSDEHLNYFLIKLNVAKGKNLQLLDTLQKQSKLLTVKNKNPIAKNWSNYKFSRFLYETFGSPVKEKNITENLEDLLLKESVNKAILDLNQQTDLIYEGAKEPHNPIKREGVVVYPRDKNISIKALFKADFLCEIDKNHPSFIRKNGQNYTEPHHLIPMKYQKNFKTSLDIPENIVSLCSNCHNQIHYGKDADYLIKILYEKRIDVLKNAQINITLKDLCKMYK